MGEVYKAENIINNKIYIGKTTKDMNHRRRNHIYEANKGRGGYFQKAIKKYGAENFIWSVLEISEDEDFLNRKEIEYISLYNSANPEFGYNLTYGGEGQRGNELTRKKISESKKGQVPWNKGLTKEEDKRVLQLSKSLENQIKTPESIEKQKQSLAEYYKTHDGPNKGKKVSEAQLEKMKSIRGEKHWNYGGHISEEHKQAVSRAQKGKPKSEKHRANMYKIPKGNIPWNKGKELPEQYKKVLCVETKEIFRSITEAIKKYPKAGTHISHCCSGKRQTAGGYHWSYLKD